MKYIYVGKMVATHGIKGEIKILSNFELKDEVFKENFPIYLGEKYTKEYISTYRKHQKYDMITLKNYNNINQVLSFIKTNIYVDRNDLNLNNKILEQDVIGLKAYINEKYIGIVKDIYLTGVNYKVIEICDKKNKILIPWNKDFIDEINIELGYIKLNWSDK